MHLRPHINQSTVAFSYQTPSDFLNPQTKISLSFVLLQLGATNTCGQFTCCELVQMAENVGSRSWHPIDYVGFVFITAYYNL